MFLKQMMKENPQLIDAAFALHQEGKILPDTYVIDVDVFLKNAEKIIQKAKERGFKMYFMLKQVGRNPWLAKELIKLGYDGAVVVDFKEAQVMMEHHIPIGNVGHLVQIPGSMVKKVVEAEPEMITVYSKEKIRQIEQAAAELDKIQGIMLRVFDDADMIYSGQTAGFHLKELEDIVRWMGETCPHLVIKGITSFPCYLYDAGKDDVFPTANLGTVKKAWEMVHAMGIQNVLINTPSATCCHTIDKMVEYGGNCGEPGHGLSGTTPMHASHVMEEIPAVVYVSEISHNFDGDAYCFGGGHYRRSHVENALIGREPSTSQWRKVVPPSDESIDYHFGIQGVCPVGDTVVMAFRFQIFVTRSDVALVRGIHSGHMELVGIYDSQGRKKA